jgi:predicted permease
VSAVQDVRQAFRLYRRSPGLSAIALLSIAITTGATAAAFTAIKAVLLDPLPYKNAGALVLLRTDYTRNRPHYDWVSWADMQDLKRANHSFESVGTYHYALVSLTGDANNAPEALYGLYVSADLFPTLGVKPMLGRNLLPEETQIGREREIILSYGLWTRRFNSDRSVIGRPVEIDRHTWTVIGVMAPGFDFPLRQAVTFKTPSQHMDFWAPDAVPDNVKTSRAAGFGAVARLKRGVSPATVQQDLDVLSAELARLYPRSNAGHVLHFTPLRERTLGFARTGLWLLMGAAVSFMLIGCANVANLLLARSLARQREIAVRLALGAGGRRILRQLITESCVLALVGGVAGYGLAALAWTLLPAAAPMSIPRLAAARTDGGVLAFTIAVALLNGILFGLAPALRASRRDPAVSLRESASRGSVGAAGNRLRSGLVVAEVTIAVTLVIIGGQLTATFVRLLRTDPGFDSKHVMASIIATSADQYGTPGHEIVFRRILSAVRAVPGVESAGLVDALPFSGENNGGTVGRADDPDAALADHGQMAEFDHVSPGYLETMGIRLRDGRWFREDDLAPGRDAAIVNDVLAKKLWPGESPLGKQICMNCYNEKLRERKRVIGVVETIRHAGLDEPVGLEVYETDKAYRYGEFLVVRTQRPAREAANGVRLAVASVDPKQPVFLSAPMSQFIGDSMADRRFVMTLLAITGILALLLAAAGVYGVISYTTSLRTSEIGLRMALGASPGNVQALVFRDGIVLASLGTVLGLILALVVAHVLRNQLAGLTSNDPLLAASAVALVLAAASLACWIPARRATRIDPMLALRDE